MHTVGGASQCCCQMPLLGVRMLTAEPIVGTRRMRSARHNGFRSGVVTPADRLPWHKYLH